MSVAHAACVVILKHHVGPAVTHHLHVAQVNNVVLIAIDVVAVVVQVVERGIEIGSEFHTKHTGNDWSRGIVAEANGDYRAIVPHHSWTPHAHGRSDGCTPAPAVVAIVVIPAVMRVTWTEAAAPAVVVVVGAWTTMVDTANVWAWTMTVAAIATARAMVAAGAIIAAMVAAAVVVAGAIIAAMVSATVVVAGAIVSAMVSTTVVVAWAIIAAMVSTAVVVVGAIISARVSATVVVTAAIVVVALYSRV